MIRPLLAIPRKRIEAYCAEHGLQPRLDRSNLDTTYFRNRLRHELLPLLETYNPNIRRRLLHTAEVIAADYELLTHLRDQAWQEVVRQATREAIFLDRAAWAAQPLSLQRALIREAAYRLRPHLRDVDFVHVEAAVRVAMERETGARATLPGGLSLLVDYDVLIVADASYVPPPEGPSLPPETSVPVAVPGETPLPDGVWRLEVDFPEEWSRKAVEANPDRWTAWLDAEALQPPVVLRTRRPGDRFRPQGLGGHAPALSDWMVNVKIPRARRDTLPLLVAGDGEILWVCGWRVSERALVRPTTCRVARLRFRQHTPLEAVAPDEKSVS